MCVLKVRQLLLFRVPNLFSGSKMRLCARDWPHLFRGLHRVHGFIQHQRKVQTFSRDVCVAFSVFVSVLLWAFCVFECVRVQNEPEHATAIIKWISTIFFIENTSKLYTIVLLYQFVRSYYSKINNMIKIMW